MKKFACLLVFATFAAVASGHAQSATEDAVNSMSSIKRPTPKPGSSATASAKATGPMEAAVYKDAKGTQAATIFAPTDTAHLVVKNFSGTKGQKFGANWYSDAGGKGKKLSGGEKTLPDTGVYNPSFNLSPASKGGFPAGAYHVDFVVDSKVVKTVKFTIK